MPQARCRSFSLVLVCSLAMLASSRAIATAPAFENVVIDPDPPEQTHCKAVGDIDGDGLPDIVLGTGRDGFGLYWYKNPEWTRTTVVPPGVGFTTDVDLADVDGDGDLDIVIPKGVHIGSSLWWYENPRPSGDPENDPWIEHEIGDGGAHDIAAADIDGDGRVDVVSRYGDTLLFLQGEDGESWRRAPIQPAIFESNDEGMDLGDVDGDGDLDVVLGGFWLENPLPDGDVAARWTRHDVSANWTHVARVTTGDIDGDGTLDLIFAPSETTHHRMAWFSANDPRGAWTEHPISASADFIHSLVAADFDLDGDIDIVSAEMHQSSDPDEVIVWFNDGAGESFTPLVISNAGSHNMVASDMDGDGDLDLVGANWDGSGPLEMWLNQTRGRPRLDLWTRHLVDGTMPWQPLFTRWGDIDGDGLVDLVSGGWWYKNPGTIDADWERNEIGHPLNNVLIVHDFDGDGDLDLFGTSGKPSGAVYAHAENDGNGNFMPASIGSGAGPFPQGVTAARFSPGDPLRIVVSWQGGEDGQSGLEVLTVPDDPWADPWAIGMLHEKSQGEGLSHGDIDGDGDLDIFQGGYWLRNDGDTWTRLQAAVFEERLGGPDRNRLADIDGDGDLDAVVGFSHFPGADSDLIWLEPPDDRSSGLWEIHTVATKVWGGFSLDVADFDRDGDLDIALGEHRGKTRAFIFENLGDGHSWAEHIVDPGGSGIDHHVGTRAIDLDGDGDLDLASIGWDNDKLWIFENTSPLKGPPPPPLTRFRRSDANADGAADLSDAIFILLYLFAGDFEPTCLEAADVDGSGDVVLTDAVAVLDFLFRSGTLPPGPFPECGTAPESTLGCASYPPCE